MAPRHGLQTNCRFHAAALNPPRGRAVPIHVTHERHPLQRLAALAAYSLPETTRAHDSRTTINGRHCPVTPPPTLSIDSYSALVGAEPLEALRAPGALIEVEVETRVGRVPVPRTPVSDGATEIDEL